MSAAISAGDTPEMRPRLPQVQGPDGGELLPRLQPQALNGLVVKVRRQLVSLHPPQFLHLLLLSLDVALVLHTDLHLLFHVRRQLRPLRVKGGQVSVVDLGPFQQGEQRAAVRRVGGAPLPQKGRERRGRRHAGMGKAADLPLHGGVLLLHHPQTLLRYQPDLIAPAGKARVSVVLAEQQAVLAAGGHDAVRFFRTLGHKVVNQRADVAFAAGEEKWLLPPELPDGVDAGRKALNGGLLIAGGTVELPRAVETRNCLHLQGGPQGQRVDTVVFNGVGRPGHDGVPQSGTL